MIDPDVLVLALKLLRALLFFALAVGVGCLAAFFLCIAIEIGRKR